MEWISDEGPDYKQVVLLRDGLERVVWIPVKFAKVGKYLKIKTSKTFGCVRPAETWQDGWYVKEVYDTVLKESIVVANRDQYRYSREVTDI